MMTIVNKTSRTVILKRLPDWTDSTCFIEERNGRLFMVSQTKVRRWRLWWNWLTGRKEKR